MAEAEETSTRPEQRQRPPAAKLSLREYPKYELVRTRKKDKEKDGRSVSSVSIRKHRDSSSGSQKPSLDSASQALTESRQYAAWDQLPPLPESTATSPLLRLDSSVPVSAYQASPTVIYTPPNLQPYLESEADSGSTVTAPQSTADLLETQEWIGPVAESSKSRVTSLDSQTPTPVNKTSSQPSCGASALTSSVTDNAEHFSAMQTVIPMSDPGTSNEKSYLPSEMANPFLPMPHPSRAWHETLDQQNCPTISGQTYKYMPIKGPDPPNTYIGQAQPIQPSFSSGQMPGDGPTNLLHRLSNAIPDLISLMNLYQESCEYIRAREGQIRQIEAQKAAETKRQDIRIEQLEKDAKSILRQNTAEVEKLESEIGALERQRKDLQDQVLLETKAKDEARLANETLRNEQKHNERKHQEDRDLIMQTHVQGREKMVSEHAADQRTLRDQLRTDARIAEATLSARVAELNRIHEQEKQTLEDRRMQERHEIEDRYTDIRRDLENSLSVKQKVLDEERRTYSRMKEAWERDRETMVHRWDEERALLHEGSEDQRQAMAIKHQREKDDMLKTFEDVQSHQQADAQDAVARVQRDLEAQSHQRSEIQETNRKLQRERDDLVKSMENVRARHGIEMQDTVRKMQKDKEETRTSLESSKSRQQLESQDQIRKLQSEISQSREPSQSRWSESQGTVASLQEEFARHKEDAEDAITKLRRETETARAGWNAEKAKIPSLKAPASGRSTPKTSLDAALQQALAARPKGFPGQ